VDVLQEGPEVLLGLPGEQMNAEVDRFLQLGGEILQHGHDAADVESADGHGDPALAELARDRHGTGELVRLDPDEADQARVAGLAYAGRDLLDRDLDVHLVVGVHLDPDVIPEDLAPSAILRDGVEASHRVRRNPGLPPLDDVAVLVVVRRLDDLDVKGPHRQPPCSWASAGYTAKALLPQ
jgi:hypothetical protein